MKVRLPRLRLQWTLSVRKLSQFKNNNNQSQLCRNKLQLKSKRIRLPKSRKQLKTRTRRKMTALITSTRWQLKTRLRHSELLTSLRKFKLETSSLNRKQKRSIKCLSRHLRYGSQNWLKNLMTIKKLKAQLPWWSKAVPLTIWSKMKLTTNLRKTRSCRNQC